MLWRRQNLFAIQSFDISIFGDNYNLGSIPADKVVIYKNRNMLEDLFKKWNKKMDGNFYLFSFKIGDSTRWQIGKKYRGVTLSDIYGAPYIIGGVNLNASYSRDYLITILKENI